MSCGFLACLMLLLTFQSPVAALLSTAVFLGVFVVVVSVAIIKVMKASIIHNNYFSRSQFRQQKMTQPPLNNFGLSISLIYHRI